MGGEKRAQKTCDSVKTFLRRRYCDYYRLSTSVSGTGTLTRKLCIRYNSDNMGKEKSRDRDARKAGKSSTRRAIGIPELERYYFSHGVDRSGARYNKVIDKIADYARIEISKDIFYLIRDGIEPQWTDIRVPGKNPGAGVIKKFELDYNAQKKEMKLHSKNKCKAFGIILGQCREMTLNAIKANKLFRELEKKDDVVGLLDLIRDLCYGTDKKRYMGWSQQAHLKRTIRFEQQPGESLQSLLQIFWNK